MSLPHPLAKFLALQYRVMKRLYLIPVLICLWVWGLFAQTYSPSDPEWRQGRHDYKKTARSPWRCSSPASVSRIWSHESSPGWFLASGSAVLNAVFDYNNDGVSEVLGGGPDDDGFAGMDVGMYLYVGSNGSIIWDITYDGDDYDAYWAVGKTPSGQNRIFSVYYDDDTWDSYYLFEVRDAITGGQIYERNESSDHSGLTIADVNGDGCPEIYRGVGGYAVSVDGCANTYTERWSRSIGTTVGIPVLADLNGDGNLEAYFPASNNNVYSYDALTGTPRWTWNTGGTFPNLLSWDIYSSVLAASDLDGDGKDELIVRTTTGIIAVKEVSGSPVVFWTWTGSPLSAVAVGDLNMDGHPDIVFRDGSGSWDFVVLNGVDGSVLAAPNGSASYCGAPTIADISGDGVFDVLISECGCGNPHAWSMSNGWSAPVWTSSGCADEPPISSDLIVAKHTDTSMLIVEGDVSCYTNVWSCPVAVLGYDDGLSVGEKAGTIVPYAVLGGKNYVEITGYSGNIGIYTPSGRLVKGGEVNGYARFELPRGVYIVRTSKGVKTVVVR